MNRLKSYLPLPFTSSGLKFGGLGVLFIFFSTLFITGCMKDFAKSNFDSIKEFSVELPTEAVTLIKGIQGGDSIKAQIRFLGQSGNEFDISAYTYLWTSLQNQDTLSTKHYLTFNDFDNQDPTLISCLLTVKEKSTGIVKYAISPVFVTTPTREGWIVLGDQSGKASLSMLTYTPQGYLKFIDLESELGINVALKGKPVSIDALGNDKYYGRGDYQWLGISTDQEIKFMKTMDFVADERISKYLNKTLQPSPSHPIKFSVNGATNFVATKDNTVYSFSIFNMLFFGVLDRSKINTYPPGEPAAEAFKASDIHTFIDPSPGLSYSCLMYDEDNYLFVRARIDGSLPNPSINGSFPLQLPFSLQGFQLKAMRTKMGTDNGEIIAFLYNSENSESYIIQFLSNGIMKFVKKIAATDANEIVQSTFIEIDYNANYLIYAKGSEIKAYDYQLEQTLSLLSFGTEQITLMKLTKHIPPLSRMPGRADIYKELLKRLVVCTYDASKPNNGGIFRLFQIPLGHQAPVKETEETGFPKIVDVAFSPIP